MSYILAHDLGTSCHKAVLTTLTGDIVACATRPLSTVTLRPGWAEQCPRLWWSAVTTTTHGLLREAGIPARAVQAVSFTGQTQATLPVDPGGTPLCDALIWLDARAHAQSAHLMRGWPAYAGYGVWRILRWLYRTNGGPTLTGRDTLAKMLWLREARPDLWRHVHRILDAKDYLLWRCTGRYVTSHDAGHLTWLMDMRRAAWSPELLRLADIRADILPELAPSMSAAGPLLPKAARVLGLCAGTPVLVGAIDVNAMAIGVGALAEGEAGVGLGTSAWVSAHSRRHRMSVATYTASITSALPGRPLVVAHQELGGGCLAWLQNMLQPQRPAADAVPDNYGWLPPLVSQAPPGADGLLFTPWLAGEYAPVHDARVRASFFGLGLQHGPAHLARAVLEGVAYNLRWALQAVEGLTGRPSPHLRVAGGGSQSDAWCQILADVCARPVLRPGHPAFSTAVGAARLAGLYLGAFADATALQKRPPTSVVFSPAAARGALYDAGFAAFRRFYRRTSELARAAAPAEATAHAQAPESCTGKVSGGRF